MQSIKVMQYSARLPNLLKIIISVVHPSGVGQKDKCQMREENLERLKIQIHLFRFIKKFNKLCHAAAWLIPITIPYRVFFLLRNTQPIDSVIIIFIIIIRYTKQNVRWMKLRCCTFIIIPTHLAEPPHRLRYKRRALVSYFTWKSQSSFKFYTESCHYWFSEKKIVFFFILLFFLAYAIITQLWSKNAASVDGCFLPLYILTSLSCMMYKIAYFHT